MGAVTVNEKLIFSERAAGRSFFVWGKLLMAAGRISPLLRRALLCFYIVFFIDDDFGGFTHQCNFEKTAASAAQRPSEKAGGLL